LIGIQRHDQLSAQLLRRVEISDVPDVQQIEATIREDDLLAIALPSLGAPTQLLARNDLVVVFAHQRSARSIASINSCAETVAVPRFITTIPPAKFASRAADSVSAPAASAAVNVAITVSPAPVTSATSSVPWIGISTGLCFFWKATIPSLPRVITSDSISICFISFWPAAKSLSWSCPIV